MERLSNKNAQMGAHVALTAIYLLYAKKYQGRGSSFGVISATALQVIQSCRNIERKKAFSLYVISFGMLLSRVGIKVYACSLLYFGSAYVVLHKCAPPIVPKSAPQPGAQPQPQRQRSRQNRTTTPPPSQDDEKFELAALKIKVMAFIMNPPADASKIIQEVFSEADQLLLKYPTSDAVKMSIDIGYKALLYYYGFPPKISSIQDLDTEKILKYLFENSDHLQYVSKILSGYRALGLQEEEEKIISCLDLLSQEVMPHLKDLIQKHTGDESISMARPAPNPALPEGFEVMGMSFSPSAPSTARPSLNLQDKAFINFYLDQGVNVNGMSFMQILDFSEEEFEAKHNFIQFIFPTWERSNHCSNAQLLNNDIVLEFSNNAELQTNLEQAFKRVLRHYGLSLRNGEMNLVNLEKTRKYLSKGNHNLKRISRILSSLRALGKKDLACALFNQLNALSEKEMPHLKDSIDSHWKKLA